MFDRKLCCCNLKGKLRESFCRVYQLWKSFKFCGNKSCCLHLKIILSSVPGRTRKRGSVSVQMTAWSWTFPSVLVTHTGCSGWVSIWPGGTQSMAHQPQAGCEAAQPLAEVTESEAHHCPHTRYFSPWTLDSWRLLPLGAEGRFIPKLSQLTLWRTPPLQEWQSIKPPAEPEVFGWMLLNHQTPGLLSLPLQFLSSEDSSLFEEFAATFSLLLYW